MLWWRGLRSRPLVDLLLLALSAVAVATAVLGPLLVRAVEQSSVADTVAVAGVANTSLAVVVNGDAKQDLAPLVANAKAALEPVRSGPARELWAPLQQWTESTANVAWQTADQDRGGGATYSRLRVADGCPGLTLTAGVCPVLPGQALVSTSDVTQQGVAVGDTLSYRLTGVDGSRSFRVVGTYDPTTVATPLTRPGQQSYTTSVTTGDPLVVDAAVVTSLPVQTQVSARVVLARPVVVSDLPLLRESVDELGSGVLTQGLTLIIDTRLPDVLDRVTRRTDAAVVLVGVVEAQSLALALFAVVVVLTRVARARSAEWGAGRLLGVPRRRWCSSVYVEPALVLLLGVPVGFAAAAGVAHAAVRSGLRPQTPLEPWRWPVLVAGAGAGLLVLLALVAVSLPSLRRPLAELVSERSEAVGTTPAGAVAQTAVVLLALGTVYVLLAGDVLGGRGPQLGLLAPALFALALAVLGVRLAVVLVRRRARRPARFLVGLVVARQAARIPSSLSPAVVVAVGVALLVFAGQVLALSVRNAELKAEATTGAATVLTVGAPRGTDLVAAVERADPGGREAMAVHERASLGTTGAERIVAVDTSRLATVATWAPRWAGVADLAAALRPPTGAPVELRGRRVDVRFDLVRVRPQPPLADTVGPATPELTLTVDTGPRWVTVVLGTVERKDRLTAAIPCTGGCRVVALGLRSGPQQPYTASLRITAVGTDEQQVGDARGSLTTPGRWHPQVGAYYDPDPDAFAATEAGPGGLKITFTDRAGGGAPAVAPSDVVDPLPVLLGPRTEVQPFAGMDSTAYGTGLAADPQLVRVVGRAQVLPRALDDGVLTDLRTASALVDPQDDSSTAEVWLAPGAPPGIEASLTASGFVVTGREQLADTSAALLREPATRGASVAQTVARAAVLLTLLALVAARVVDAPRRRADWRSIADAGVRARTLRRLAGVEIAVPALLAVVLGTASGVVAVLLSAPRLPLVDLSTPGPPLALGLDWSLVLLAALVSAVVVVVVAVVGAVLETRPAAVS